MTDVHYLLIKLVSGEEILGKSDVHIDKLDEYVNLSDVVTFDTELDDGGGRVFLSPYMGLSILAPDKQFMFTFSMKHVMLCFTPPKKMQDFYDGYLAQRGEDPVWLDESVEHLLDHNNNKKLN